MRKILLAVGLLVWLGGVAAAQAPAESAPPAVAPSDERARALVDEMIQAMGGQGSWEQARYLRFDWVVEVEGKEVAHVRHLWDRYEGRYRVEWTARDGKKLAVLFNVNTRAGHVWVDGQPAAAEDEKKYLEAAYGRFINDGYWLLMPWKLKDPGVKLDYVGETELDGQTYDLLHVSFGQVGLTPGDQYWAYINRQTHLMDRWAYFLESFKDKGAPALEKATPWRWLRWEDVGGGLHLAREKVEVDQNRRISFPVLQVLKDVEGRVFESLEAPLPSAPAAGE